MFQEACRFGHVAILNLIIESAKQSAIDNEFVTQSNDWKKWLFKENYFAEESMLNALKKEDRVSKHYEMGKYLLYIKFSEKLGKDYIQ